MSSLSVLRRLLAAACLAVVAVFSLVATAAYEPFEYEYAEGLKLRLGMDFRLRYEGFDRNVIWPDGNAPPNGPAVEYLRVRTRLWGSVDLAENLVFNVRLVNRWHYFTSHILSDNNNGWATWEAPDEVIFDQLSLTMSNLFDSPWSVTLGRQDMILGNGMIFLEGTPYDQGRTIYFDGVTIRYGGEQDKLTLFAFYNDYKDEFLVINDRNRRLRRGDVFTTGAYWTHEFDKAVKTDLFYNYTDIDDDRWQPWATDSSERNHPADENARIHTYGARVFGSPHELVDYSAELAFQNGSNFRATSSQKMTGMMADLRLNLKAPQDIPTKPSLLLEYTYMSGNDPGSPDEFEGWHPLFAEYPIWREELLPIMLNGNWTNLHQYRAEAKFRLPYKLVFTAAYAYLLADEGRLGTGGGGDNFGQLLSAFLDFPVTDQLSFSLESAFFFPGDYWTDGHNSKWYRAQVVYKF